VKITGSFGCRRGRTVATPGCLQRRAWVVLGVRIVEWLIGQQIQGAGTPRHPADVGWGHLAGIVGIAVPGQIVPAAVQELEKSLVLGLGEIVASVCDQRIDGSNEGRATVLQGEDRIVGEVTPFTERREGKIAEARSFELRVGHVARPRRTPENVGAGRDLQAP
jgi:hypothetical protein